MATYVILSRLGPEAFKDPSDFPAIAEKVSAEIKKRCPGVTWKESWATLGQFDVVDVVEAKDPRDVERAAMIIRGLGGATTETMPATPWRTFLDGLRS